LQTALVHKAASRHEMRGSEVISLRLAAIPREFLSKPVIQKDSLRAKVIYISLLLQHILIQIMFSCSLAFGMTLYAYVKL
jgi:hypothetical protein